jgi:opacity protein-like surface antigen
LGSGIGFSYLEIDGTSNVLSIEDDTFEFAWNLGAGVNYALTEKVELSVGYRYVGLGEQKIDIFLGAANQNTKLEFTPQVHELRVQIRIEVFEFLNSWR